MRIPRHHPVPGFHHPHPNPRVDYPVFGYPEIYPVYPEHTPTPLEMYYEFLQNPEHHHLHKHHLKEEAKKYHRGRLFHAHAAFPMPPPPAFPPTMSFPPIQQPPMPINLMPPPVMPPMSPMAPQSFPPVNQMPPGGGGFPFAGQDPNMMMDDGSTDDSASDQLSPDLLSEIVADVENTLKGDGLIPQGGAAGADDSSAGDNSGSQSDDILSAIQSQIADLENQISNQGSGGGDFSGNQGFGGGGGFGGDSGQGNDASGGFGGDGGFGGQGGGDGQDGSNADGQDASGDSSGFGGGGRHQRGGGGGGQDDSSQFDGQDAQQFGGSGSDQGGSGGRHQRGGGSGHQGGGGYGGGKRGGGKGGYGGGDPGFYTAQGHHHCTAGSAGCICTDQHKCGGSKGAAQVAKNKSRGGGGGQGGQSHNSKSHGQQHSKSSQSQGHQTSHKSSNSSGHHSGGSSSSSSHDSGFGSGGSGHHGSHDSGFGSGGSSDHHSSSRGGDHGDRSDFAYTYGNNPFMADPYDRTRSLITGHGMTELSIAPYSQNNVYEAGESISVKARGFDPGELVTVQLYTIVHSKMGAGMTTKMHFQQRIGNTVAATNSHGVTAEKNIRLPNVYGKDLAVVSIGQKSKRRVSELITVV